MSRPASELVLRQTIPMVREGGGSSKRATLTDAERVSTFDRPVLLLLGSESPPGVRAAVDAVDDALPDGRISVLEGQDHFAHLVDPELLARAIVDFVLD